MIGRLFALVAVIASVAMVQRLPGAVRELEDSVAARLYGGTPIYYVCNAESTVDTNWKWCTPACSDFQPSYMKSGYKQYEKDAFIPCKRIAPTCGYHSDTWPSCY